MKMKGQVEAEVVITVPKQDVIAAMNRAYGMLRRTARVRGFRQGKAPKAILQKMYGKAVRSEVQGDLVQQHLFKALQEHKIEPLSDFKFGDFELKEDADFEFEVAFEVRPRLETLNCEGIEIDRVHQAVEAQDVESELQRLRGALASVSDLPEPRPAQSGDVAMVAMKRWVDGNWEEGGLPDQELIIGEGQAPKELEEALIGMSIDEEKVVDLGASDALEENRLRYLVRLSALKERKLPDLDDEFAKDTGDYDTIADLKADIEKRVLKGRNQAEDQRVRVALFDALREKNPMDLPPSLLARQTEGIKQQFFGQILSQLDGDDEKAQDTMDKVDDSARKSAESIIHQHLMMMEIARLENISVSDDEIEEEITRRAEESELPVPMVRAEMGKEGRREDLARQLLEKKIFDFVKSRVTINELDSPPDKGDAADGAKQPAGKAPAKAASEDKSDDVKPAKKVTEKAETKKTTAKKTAAKKTTAKKTAAKKTAAKKTTAKKTTAKKTAAKKTTAKKTTAKKTTAKKTTATKKPSASE